MRTTQFPRRILVPVAGGPNARLSLELAITQADAIEQHTGKRPEVTALNLITENGDETIRDQRRSELLRELEMERWSVELSIVPAEDVVQGILREAAGFDQIVIGAPEEGVLEQTLFGSIPQRVAEKASTTVVMVKHHHPVKYGLKRWFIRGVK